MEQPGCHLTDFHEILYLSLFRRYIYKIHFHENLTRITGTLHEDQYTILIICRSVLLRTRNVSDKICTNNYNTHFVLKFCFRKIMPFLRIMWKNRVEPDRPQMTIWRMRIGCWIPKAKNLHSEYVLLFHCTNGCSNAPQCYVIRIVPLLLINTPRTVYRTET